jgi:hypothetical protein
MLKSLMRYPEGMPLFYSFLKRQGYSAQLLYKYVKSGWLRKVGPGVYQRDHGKTDPLLTIKAIQQHLKLPFYVGAQTAMYMQGVMHYIKFKHKHKCFILNQDLKLSKWILSFEALDIIKRKLFKPEMAESFVYQDEIKISSHERALIEMSALIPKKATFDELVHLMDLSPSLRAPLIQQLLENCTSIRAKRIFLYVAEGTQHSWFKRINVKKIYLGKGTRQIVKNGIYIKKYDICIPRLNNE